MNIKEYIKEQRLITDGAMGTYYEEKYSEDTVIAEKENLKNPEKIKEIHLEYLRAGARLIRTNTFAANTMFLADMQEVKELNEALVSRFLVIDMPAQNEETLGFIFNRMFPDAKKEAVEQFMGVFLDLQQKSMNSEISTKPLDLRGLLGAMKIGKTGLSPWQAVRMGIVNKTFDIFEKVMFSFVVL